MTRSFEKAFEFGENVPIDRMPDTPQPWQEFTAVLTGAEMYCEGKTRVHVHFRWKRHGERPLERIDGHAADQCALFYSSRETASELGPNGNVGSKNLDAHICRPMVRKYDVPVLVYVRQIAQNGERVMGHPSFVRLQPLDSCLGEVGNECDPIALSFEICGPIGDRELDGSQNLVVGGSDPLPLHHERVNQTVERTTHSMDNVSNHHAPVGVDLSQIDNPRFVGSCFRIELDGEMVWCTVEKNAHGLFESVEMFTRPL